MRQSKHFTSELKSSDLLKIKTFSAGCSAVGALERAERGSARCNKMKHEVEREKYHRCDVKSV